MIKKFIQLLSVVVFFGTPLIAMDKFEDGSTTITVKREFVENDFSDWFLVPLVQPKPLVEMSLDIFDVFSPESNPAPSTRKKKRDNNIPMELLGIKF